jgi:N-acyl-D-amino-acid deacylase
VNVALLIGHGSVREAVLGSADREPTAAELERMRDLVRRAMREGAFGLSSGLFYAPGSYAKTDEVIDLARIAAESGGVYTSHIRDEGNYSIGLVAAVEEVIRIADEAGLRGIVSHMKALGPENWGLSVAALARIDRARARGVQVFADQYPYEASSTSLTGAVIPRWAEEGGGDRLRARIQAADTRAKLLPEVRANIARRGGPASLVIAQYGPERTLEGRSLDEVARTRGVPPEEAALDLVSKGGVSIVSFNMWERDIDEIMRQPYTMTSSDGGLVFPTEGRPHPRNYGAFARKIARYVRGRGTIGLESAIRSMTSLPAAVFGLDDRGILREGARADVVIFDPAAVRDAATYTDPHQLAEGMSCVLVNGTIVIDGGRFTPALPGKVLRRPSGSKDPESGAKNQEPRTSNQEP